VADKNKDLYLVAVDFTKYSEEALLFAADIAECKHAKIVVLHVIHDSAEAPGFYAPKGKKKKYIVTMEETAGEMMDEFLKRIRKAHPNMNSLKKAQPLLVIGTPVTRIIEIAKKKKAKMIFVGSQGRTGLSHLLVGSKAERVVQFSPIPVVVVKSMLKK